MSCPYYTDFTRECIKKYPAILQYRDYSKCESEGYHKCLIYNILTSDFQCKYLDTCLNMFPEDAPEFFILLNQDDAVYAFVTKPTFQYCLSKENYSRCARFLMKEEGKQPPPGLSPDGQTLNIADTLLKKKIALEKPS
jgi:hypothetical protein